MPGTCSRFHSELGLDQLDATVVASASSLGCVWSGSGEWWWMTSRSEILATPLGFLNFPRTPPPPVPCPILNSVVARFLALVRLLIYYRSFQVSFVLSVFQDTLATSAPSLLCDTQARTQRSISIFNTSLDTYKPLATG